MKRVIFVFYIVDNFLERILIMYLDIWNEYKHSRNFSSSQNKKRQNDKKNLFLLQNFVDSSNNDVIELNCQFIDWWNQANASQFYEQQNKVDASWFVK
jgi:hypothetical protein